MSRGECFVEHRKLFEYLLNPSHDAGKSKAKFFIEIAGFSRDALEFAAALRKHFQDNPKIKTNRTEYGQKLEVIGPMAMPKWNLPSLVYLDHRSASSA